MNNEEIKEILEKPNVYSFNDECYLYFGDYNILKDYITNLQEERNSMACLVNDIQESLEDLQQIEKDHRKLNGELREENKRYKKIFEGKERFSKIMPDDIDFIVLSKADYDRQQEDIELTAIELRNRIDKAIEYMKYNATSNYFDKEKNMFRREIDLLNILQGESNETNNM